MVRMLKVVTFMFALCVLPTNVMWLWLDFGKAEEQYDKFWELVTFCNIITFSNSAANPICYTIVNESYRNAFKDQFSKIFCKILGKPIGVEKDLSARRQKKRRKDKMTSVLL